MFFANNTILFCFLSLVIYLNFLIHKVCAQIFISTADLLIPIGLHNKTAKAKIETNPLTAKDKMSECLI